MGGCIRKLHAGGFEGMPEASARKTCDIFSAAQSGGVRTRREQDEKRTPFEKKSLCVRTTTEGRPPLVCAHAGKRRDVFSVACRWCAHTRNTRHTRTDTHVARYSGITDFLRQ